MRSLSLKRMSMEQSFISQGPSEKQRDVHCGVSRVHSHRELAKMWSMFRVPPSATDIINNAVCCGGSYISALVFQLPVSATFPGCYLQ